MKAKVMSKARGRRRCVAKTASGKPCGMAPLADADRCFNHAPEAAPERAKARRRGGQQREVPNLLPLPKVPDSLRDVPSIQRVLEGTVFETLAQRNSPMRSRALGSLLLIALRALEIGSLEERVAALEAQLATRHLRRA